jgi:hypothetical protein
VCAETANSFLTWSPPEIGRAVHMEYDAVERLNIEVMRGFGVTRRRGTETGGILLGRVDRRVKPISVHIHDFEVVPCEYAFGPSYELSANDMALFREAVARWQPSLERDSYVVGFFRSHTREGFMLNEKDAGLFREFFRDPLDVALLIKPFATRAATAGFFVQDKTALVTSATPLEFAFVVPGRTEAPRQAGPQAGPAGAAVRQAVTPPTPPKAVASGIPVAVDDRPMFGTYHSSGQDAAGRWQSKLSWGLFGITLLAFGAACGYEFAGTKSRQPVQAAASGQQARLTIARPDQYAVGLQVRESNGAVLVQWDRNAAPVHAALHAVLTVSTGSGSKDVRLGFAELRNGMVIYPHTAPQLGFRLEVFFRDNRSFVETVEFRPSSASR